MADSSSTLERRSFSQTADALDHSLTGQALGVAEKMSGLRDLVNEKLAELLPPVDQTPAILHEAMRFSLLGEGKRVRPVMALLVAQSAPDAHEEASKFALTAGCAVEMVHTASLILDDLPSMDNADTRRGRETTHKRYGEATAILAAIGLMNRATQVLSECVFCDDQTRRKAVSVLSGAIGSDGLIAGQQIDLSERKNFQDPDRVENLNWLKTGVLFVASAELGAVAARLDAETTRHVCDFAKHVGLAFQTADDLIDVKLTAEQAGKTTGLDIEKPTLVSLQGADFAKQTCERHLARAQENLTRSGLRSHELNALVDAIFGRKA
jgi:geranylgeranyl diphosphate synthase type II